MIPVRGQLAPERPAGAAALIIRVNRVLFRHARAPAGVVAGLDLLSTVVAPPGGAHPEQPVQGVRSADRACPEVSTPQATATSFDRHRERVLPREVTGRSRVALRRSRRRAVGLLSGANVAERESLTHHDVPDFVGDRAPEDRAGMHECVEFAVLPARIDARRQIPEQLLVVATPLRTTGRAAGVSRTRRRPRTPRRWASRPVSRPQSGKTACFPTWRRRSSR